MYCNNCGGFVQDGSPTCPNCGQMMGVDMSQMQQPYQQPMQQPYQQPMQQPYQQPMQQPMYQQPVMGYNDAQPANGLAVASMVLGIIALVFTFTGSLAIIGFVLAAVGIVLAGIAKSKGNTGGMATAGLVTSIIAAAITLTVFIACVACYASVYNAFSY